jgi:hypothetical protein
VFRILDLLGFHSGLLDFSGLLWLNDFTTLRFITTILSGLLRLHGYRDYLDILLDDFSFLGSLGFFVFSVL